MKKQWEAGELMDYFSFLPEDFRLLGKRTGSTRLGFAVLFKFFQHEGRFPTQEDEIPASVLQHIAKQVNLDAQLFATYPWETSSSKRHRRQIRDHFGFRETTEADREKVTLWLGKKVWDYALQEEPLQGEVIEEYRHRKIELPSENKIKQMVRSAIRKQEQAFFQNTYQRLSEATLTKMNQLINTWQNLDDADEQSGRMTFRQLTLGPGKATRGSLLFEIEKWKTLRDLELPDDLFAHVPSKLLRTYRLRAASEGLTELRRHPAPIQSTLLAAFFWSRSHEITDNLVEMFISIVHNLYVRSERKIQKKAINEIKKVSGKNNKIGNVLEAVLDHPDGVIRDVLYDVVDPATLREILKELRYNNTVYREQVYGTMRSSYGATYRKALSELLQMLVFRSNNEQHQPIIKALSIIEQYMGTKQKYFPVSDGIPIDEVIRPMWLDTVWEKDPEGRPRINRMNYEICVLHVLRERLRCKEIWVEGALRYRNPDQDLPTDFGERRNDYYKMLDQPMDTDTKIGELKQNLHEALQMLDKGLARNKKVTVSNYKDGWISVSPLEPQPEPVHLDQLKQHLAQRWWMVKLIDMLKEADLRIGFTDTFRTLATHQRLDPDTVQKRLLLCLYGLGTNTGLKRVAAGNPDVSYKDLLYMKRKFIYRDNLKAANMQVANAILRERLEDVWGQSTTTCASDGKKIGAWDQNLLTEWHVRYHGRGIMIYWHVEKKSMCVCSQVTSCSSSEVSAMLEGLLRHGTDKDIQQNFVDTHGQSEVAFAFCHLLGFQLMPRFKNIGSQKLSPPESGATDLYPNLEPVLARPIKWDLIRKQYDQMMKYATALRLGTADAESILRRFRKNPSHPTYQALHELGKVVKTMFLCQYLHSEPLRQEVEEGLNTTENWNSAMDFIFFGRSGEITNNQPEEMEIAVLCLHLLQNSLVYINTLQIQQLMQEKQWMSHMSSQDFRALTPLIYNHVNPYGDFQVDLNKRLTV